MSKFFFTIIIFYSLINISFSQIDPGIGDAELALVNQSEFATNGNGKPVLVKMYPVGAIFNGQKKYNLSAVAPIASNTPFDRKIIGYQIILNQRISSSQDDWYVRANFDDYVFGTPSDSKFSLGMGRYKIEFYELHQGGNANNPLDYDLSAGYCFLDWSDSRLYTGNPSFPGTIDIHIEYFNSNDIRFHWRSNNNFYPVQEVNNDIKIWEQYGSGYPSTVQVKGPFFSDNSSTYLNYPIDARDSGAVNHINYEDFYVDLQIINQGVNIRPNGNLYFISSSLIFENNINFTIDANESISFTGTGSGLVCKNGSTINFPQEYLLSILNGSYLKAYGCTFTSSSNWKGIKLENSSYDTIVNCTFNNAKTSVSIIDNILSNHPNKIIRKNTFNISQDNGRGVDVRNQNRILIDSNIFNFSNSNSTVGIFFRNSEPPNAGALQSFYYNLNIVNNKFHNGYLPVYISGLTSARTPFYVYNNNFYGTNTYSIAGLKITGDIKNNRFDVNNNNRSVGLWNSNPNIFGNIFNSVSTNMYLNYSFPSIAPYPNSTDQLVWSAGRNSFNSVTKENINMEGSYPYLNNGINAFTINDSYHIFGSMPDSVNEYYMTYNCWHGYNEIPNPFLYKYINDTIFQNVSANYTPTFCDEQSSTLSEVYTDKGSEIIDTTLITDDFDSEPPSGDESMLGQARISNGIKDFPGAIINYKGLINNYAESELICTSLYEMYDNYSALDTSGNQNITDVLFGDLKQYLQGRINTSNYTEDFERQAFDVILMCETNMKNYEVALTGYEFIALYHPNAEQRMLASWDYDEIEEMINGSGGGEKQLGMRNEELGIEELEINELLRLDKLIDDNPLMKKMKKNYEKKYAFEKNIKSDKVTEIKLIQRAKENIFKGKFLQKEEKEKRYMEDLKLLMTTGNTDTKEIENTISKPKEFILNQNYPNPFNPVTNISYSIPVSSLVNLKVFDIAGKEIVTLVNEYKQNGSYQVTFNGINLPSGVYYFRLKSGEWNQVRKMLLIK